MTRPSRGWRESMATMRKYGRCFRPIRFMRIRTATAPPQASGVRSQESGTNLGGDRGAATSSLTPDSCSLPPLLLLALLGPLLGALAVPGADLRLQHLGAGHE